MYVGTSIKDVLIDSEVENFPLLSEEGWLRDQVKSRSVLRRADGVVINHNKVLEFDHHPVRSIEVASRHFVFLSRPPLLGEEGKVGKLCVEQQARKPVYTVAIGV
jgi:hypothetical protein